MLRILDLLINPVPALAPVLAPILALTPSTSFNSIINTNISATTNTSTNTTTSDNKLNKKKIKYMRRKLYNEFKEFRKNHPDRVNLDLKQFPPAQVKEIKEKNQNLKSINTIFMHYDIQNFQIIKGIY